MKRYCIVTLGCKVNQCESAAIGHLLEQQGFHCDAGAPDPDVVVINTCTVTGKAAMQSRQAIRKAVRSHPEARIVVTGCHVEVAAPAVGAMEGVHLVVDNANKMELVALLDRLPPAGGSATPAFALRDGCTDHCFAALPAVSREDRTRAFLKIQDGCNTCCTYCIVPRTRGPSRSMPTADVHRHIRRLGENGFREVVLTGIHLGAYGLDLEPPTTLTDLIDRLSSPPMVDRLRVSSIEPTEITSALVALFAQRAGALCPHFHVPLQSGDNGVLRRMGRQYTREQYAEVIHAIARLLPMAAIGVDVMAGFPGESEAAFEQTCALIQSLPVTYLHVFPFSPRQGTPAVRFTPKVPERIAKERCRYLRAIGEEKRRRFMQSMVGRELVVLVQTVSATPCPTARGMSENYLPVMLSGVRLATNSLVRARIQGVSDAGILLGEQLPPVNP